MSDLEARVKALEDIMERISAAILGAPIESTKSTLKIKDLTDGMKRVNITGKIAAKTETRQVNTQHGPTVTANATLTDDSGAITLSLWGEDVDKVAVGNEVLIENGYVSSYKGERQLNVGKWGKLVVT